MIRATSSGAARSDLRLCGALALGLGLTSVACKEREVVVHEVIRVEEPVATVESLLANMESACTVDRCAVLEATSSSSACGRAERSLADFVSAEPAHFATLAALSAGSSDRAIIALDIANRILTRWQSLGEVEAKLSRADAQAFIDRALTNRCAGFTLSPLVMPKGPLAPLVGSADETAEASDAAVP